MLEFYIYYQENHYKNICKQLKKIFKITKIKNKKNTQVIIFDTKIRTKIEEKIKIIKKTEGVKKIHQSKLTSTASKRRFYRIFFDIDSTITHNEVGTINYDVSSIFDTIKKQSCNRPYA